MILTSSTFVSATSLNEIPANHYSIEKGVKHPVKIPNDILVRLRQDERVQTIISHQSDVKVVPADWFEAEKIQLENGSKPALLIMAKNPKLFGANIAPIWVFKEGSKGYELILNTYVHTLAIQTQKTNGLRDLQVLIANKKNVLTSVYKFNGKVYAKAK